MLAQSAEALQPKHDGQGSGHEQKIIKVRMQKRPGPVEMSLEKMAEMRADDEPVENVGGQRDAKQAVMQITEPPHNASSAKPEVIASSVLKSKIIAAILRLQAGHARKNLPQFFRLNRAK